MSRLEEILARLESKFQPQAAADMNVVFQLDLDEGTSLHYIVIRDQQCTITAGEHPDPNITLLMSEQTFIDVLKGEISGTSAFMSGRLRAEGDVMLATKLGKLFQR